MTKHFLYCKFEDKEKVKEKGARWDIERKKWFCSDITGDLHDFEEVEIDIPYDKKDEYKLKYSMRWSPDVKSWITNRKIAREIENEV